MSTRAPPSSRSLPSRPAGRLRANGYTAYPHSAEETQLHETRLTLVHAGELVERRVQKVSHRVKRWRGGRMMLRWCAASVLDASTRFRRIKGHREMPTLLAALRAHEGTLDQQQAVA